MFSFLQRFLHFILPSQCPCCDKGLEEEEKGICQVCLSKIKRIEPPFCSICGVPFVSQEVENHSCGPCTLQKRNFTMARALGYYEGSLRLAIHLWKYERRLSLTPFFGELMAEGFFRYWEPYSIDLLLPVPLHPKRLRERGFNQSLLLAKALSHRTGIPFQKRLIRKRNPTPPLMELSRVERERTIRGSFYVMNKENLKGKKILLIDDVYTTGATVNECARVLRFAGAARVDVLTLAHAIKIF